MKRILLTLVCLGMLGTAGCYYDPSPYGPGSGATGYGAYQGEYRDYDRRDYARRMTDDERREYWRQRRLEREHWQRDHDRYDRRR
jgi:hypothetical protein